MAGGIDYRPKSESAKSTFPTSFRWWVKKERNQRGKRKKIPGDKKSEMSFWTSKGKEWMGQKTHCFFCRKSFSQDCIQCLRCKVWSHKMFSYFERLSYYYICFNFSKCAWRDRACS